VKIRVFIVTCLCLLPCQNLKARVWINELVASNRQTLTDAQGNTPDWIELYNDGPQSVALQGWFLTDDPALVNKWAFPENMVVPAHGYLVVLASGDTSGSVVDSQGYAHTNFALDEKGEYLALTDAQGMVVHEIVPAFPPLETDISYGLWEGEFRFFANPTPGQANEQAFDGFVETPLHSHERGFYSEPFGLKLFSHTPNVSIHFTLDGSEPSAQRGIVYTPAMSIPIATTLHVRAIASRPGWRTSRVSTHTYIFVEDVAQQPSDPTGWPTDWGFSSDAHDTVPADYEMDPRVVNNALPGYTVQDALVDIPTVSISMALDDFISDATGIYANSQNRWERKCAVEYILPDGTPGFQEDCKIEVHGNASRRPFRMQKHSLRLTFTSEYGAPKLKYPLFPDSDVDEFNQLVLRACFTDSWGLVSWGASRYRPNDSQYIRDIWMKDSLRDMGQPSSHGNFVHVYVNGLYFGLHNLTERVGEDFYAAHLGGDPEHWEVNEDLSSPDARWRAMMSFDPRLPAQYTAMQAYLDMENFADYMLLHFYADAEDWPHHNGYAAANAISGDGQYRFFVWDQEIVLDYHGRAGSRIDSGSGAGELFQKMRTSPEFRLLFADRVYKHCFNDGALSVAGSQNRYQTLGAGIDKAIVAESARWGDTQVSTPYGNAIQQPSPLDNFNHNNYPPVLYAPDYTLTREDNWLVELDNVVTNYIPAIHDVNNSFALINLFRSKALYPDIDPPEFLVNDVKQHGGVIPNNAQLTLTSPQHTGTLYYTLDGNDVRLPEAGGLVTSSALVAEDAIKRIWIPTQDIGLAWTGGAEPFDDTHWTDGQPRLRGTTGGVGYERSTGYDPFITYNVETSLYNKASACYIRIPFFADNPDTATINYMALRVRYDDGFVAYLNGTRIASANAASTPVWNAGATASHNDSAATEFQQFDCSGSLGLLKEGDNLLAIHGMNQSTSSSDFLVSASLVVGEDLREENMSPSTLVYAGRITLTESVQIKARILAGEQWSALHEATYSVGPIHENLRVTELMYHPEAGDTEFIELQNIGTESINLNQVKFTQGIEFTFDSLDLAPNAFVLIVQDQNAFELAYDTSNLSVAGQYTGQLNNGGESIQLQDAIGNVLVQFTYKDKWFKTTDGQGYSLTVIDPTLADPETWDKKATWQPSPIIGGTPGY